MSVSKLTITLWQWYFCQNAAIDTCRPWQGSNSKLASNYVIYIIASLLSYECEHTILWQHCSKSDVIKRISQSCVYNPPTFTPFYCLNRLWLSATSSSDRFVWLTLLDIYIKLYVNINYRIYFLQKPTQILVTDGVCFPVPTQPTKMLSYDYSSNRRLNHCAYHISFYVLTTYYDGFRWNVMTDKNPEMILSKKMWNMDSTGTSETL